MFSEEEKHFTRRAFILGACQTAAVCTIVGRLAYLQLFEGNKYKRLADENRLLTIPTPSERALVFDSKKNLIVGNRSDYQVVLVPQLAKNVEQIREDILKLKNIFPSFDKTEEWVKKQLIQASRFGPLILLKNITWEQLLQFSAREPEMHATKANVVQERYYPWGESLAHLTGYVVYNKNKPTGIIGVEKVFEEQLSGQPGYMKLEMNAQGKPMRKLSEVMPDVGKELSLTIRADLQQKAYDLMKDMPGSCVVMEVKTGRVIICLSTPSFDPNRFVKGIEQGYWEEITKDVRKPLLNRAFSGLYPPGSCVKPVVALAALSANVDPERTVFCSGSTMVGTHKFHCWNRKGHGEVDMRQAIAQSCDVYFYEIARRTGIDTIARFAQHFGLGSSFDLGLAQSKAGVFPNRAWKDKNIGRPWLVGDTVLTGIGQGYTLITPVQLATMAARLSSGNLNLKPFLLMDQAPTLIAKKEDEEEGRALKIKDEWWAVVHDAMRQVVSSPAGTGRAAYMPRSSWQLAGKTGTAQIKSISREDRMRAEQGLQLRETDWDKRDHALFVGYAPAHNPVYAMSLLLEHQLHSGRSVVPVAGKIMRHVMDAHEAEWM